MGLFQIDTRSLVVINPYQPMICINIDQLSGVDLYQAL